MHQRNICLCPECIAQISVHEAQEAERVRVGRLWFDAAGADKTAAVPLCSGVVRRVRKAA